MTEATSLELHLDGQPVPARLALPEGPGPHPGVLVIHELWGLTADIERICERLATAGYAALAGELYGPGPRPLCIARAIRDLTRAEGELGMSRAKTAFELLRRRPEVDASRTGAIGFCMGGGFALLLGATEDLRATSVNYGRVPESTARLAGLCPVVGSYGGTDRDLLPHFERLRGFLEENSIPHDVELYPQAGHSFMNRTVPGPAARLVRPLAAIEYRHSEAEDAWRRILAFFAEHLGD
ncbi:MAG: dienelactone hydrolase family protein [Solirubrobacteraceae bacterium]